MKKGNIMMKSPTVNFFGVEFTLIKIRQMKLNPANPSHYVAEFIAKEDGSYFELNVSPILRNKILKAIVEGMDG